MKNHNHLRVYIAGPYTKGDVAINVRNAIATADAVLDLGHFPYLPHLTHFWHLVLARPYHQWLSLDIEWLEQCQVLIRIPGESEGADKEVQHAKSLDIPVFYGLSSFLNFMEGG